MKYNTEKQTSKTLRNLASIKCNTHDSYTCEWGRQVQPGYVITEPVPFWLDCQQKTAFWEDKLGYYGILIAQLVRRMPTNWIATVQIPVEALRSFHHWAHTGSGAYQPPIQWLSETIFREVKSAGAWSWLHIFVTCRGSECVKPYLCVPYVFMMCCFYKETTSPF